GAGSIDLVDGVQESEATLLNTVAALAGVEHDAVDRLVDELLVVEEQERLGVLVAPVLFGQGEEQGRLKGLPLAGVQVLVEVQGIERVEPEMAADLFRVGGRKEMSVMVDDPANERIFIFDQQG